MTSNSWKNILDSFHYLIQFVLFSFLLLSLFHFKITFSHGLISTNYYLHGCSALFVSKLNVYVLTSHNNHLSGEIYDVALDCSYQWHLVTSLTYIKSIYLKWANSVVGSPPQLCILHILRILSYLAISGNSYKWIYSPLWCDHLFESMHYCSVSQLQQFKMCGLHSAPAWLGNSGVDVAKVHKHCTTVFSMLPSFLHIPSFISIAPVNSFDRGEFHLSW